MAKLTNLEAFEVSLVRRGANKRKFLLLKNEQSEESMNKILKALLEKGLEKEEEIDAALDDLLPENIKKDKHVRDAVKGMMSILQQVRGELPPAIMGKLMSELNKLMDLEPAEKEKDIDEAKKKKDEEDALKEKEKIAKEAKEKAELESKKKKIEKSDEDKRIDAKVESILKEREEKIQKENDNLRADLEKEKDIRISKEFEEKAAIYKHLPAKQDELSAVLKEASIKLDAKTFEKLENILKSSEKALQENTLLLKELGNSRPGESKGGAWSKIEKAAEELMQKDSKLTKESAADLAMQKNPQLYQDYENEREAV